MDVRRRSFLVWAAVAVLAVCAAYANSFQNGFHFDDFHTVTDNPAIRDLSNVPRFFADASTFSVLPANRTYRPVVSTSLALDYALGHGYQPFWFHLSTFACFLLLLGLLFLLYERVFQQTDSCVHGEWFALAGAVWFGLHPAMAETVNYVIQRGDLYCTAGCVAALVVFACYTQGRKTGLYLLPLAFALLSKPPAAVFPALLFFYVFFFEDAADRERLKKSALAVVPSIAVTAGLMILQSAMTPKSFMPSIVPAWNYRLTQPYVWLRYVWALLLPIHLNVDSDLNAFRTFDARAAAGLLFVAALGLAIWRCSRKRVLYPIAYGLIWFVVTQLPTSLYPLSEVENDHRMFFSFVGLILAVVWAVRLSWLRTSRAESRRWLRPVLVGCVLLALSGYAWGVHARNHVWKDEETLWLDDVQKSPHNGRGLMIYGLTQMNKGLYPVALDYFQRALEFTPNYPTLEINLGVVHGAMGNALEAERHFQRATLLAPNDDMGHAFYGQWLIQQSRTAEAIAHLKAAVALNPSRPMQHDLLLRAYEQTGDTTALRSAAEETLRFVPGDRMAESIFKSPPDSSAAFWINLSLQQYQSQQYEASIRSAKRALELDPKSAAAYNNIGAAYGAMQQWDDAVSNERKALQLQPGMQIAQNNLAAFLQKKLPAAAQPQPGARAADLVNQSLSLNRAGRFQESTAAAQAALAIDPSSAVAWNNIAADDEALKQWDNAIAAAQKAIALQPDFQLAKNNLAWSQSQKKLAAAKP